MPPKKAPAKSDPTPEPGKNSIYGNVYVCRDTSATGNRIWQICVRRWCNLWYAHAMYYIYCIEGEWMSVDGAIQRHGKGTYSYGNNVYTGEWANDHMSGEGSIICILFSFSQELWNLKQALSTRYVHNVYMRNFGVLFWFIVVFSLNITSSLVALWTVRILIA